MFFRQLSPMFRRQPLKHLLIRRTHPRPWLWLSSRRLCGCRLCHAWLCLSRHQLRRRTGPSAPWASVQHRSAPQASAMQPRNSSIRCKRIARYRPRYRWFRGHRVRYSRFRCSSAQRLISSRPRSYWLRRGGLCTRDGLRDCIRLRCSNRLRRRRFSALRLGNLSRTRSSGRCAAIALHLQNDSAPS